MSENSSGKKLATEPTNTSDDSNPVVPPFALPDISNVFKSFNEAHTFKPIDVDRLEAIGRDLLTALGQDLDDENLQDTPRRFAEFWQSFIEYDDDNIETAFESHHDNTLVVVGKMRVWSMCAHHLLPFWCDISIAYYPFSEVLGLSKFARIAHLAAHKLQLQERLAQDILDSVLDVCDTKDVMVYASGQHLCMAMRGVQTPAEITTVIRHGIFEEAHFYQDAMSIIKSR